MNDPTRCDSEVYENGLLVFVTHSIGSAGIETWVRRVAAESGQRVDWYFVGGRACVKALGNIAEVCAAICRLMPEHDALYCADYPRLRGSPPRPSWWTTDDPTPEQLSAIAQTIERDHAARLRSWGQPWTATT